MFSKKILRKKRKGIAAEKNWTREEIETLITLWEGNEILYVSLSDYLNKDKKAAVKQTAEQLETNDQGYMHSLSECVKCYVIHSMLVLFLLHC